MIKSTLCGPSNQLDAVLKDFYAWIETVLMGNKNVILRYLLKKLDIKDSLFYIEKNTKVKFIIGAS